MLVCLMERICSITHYDFFFLASFTVYEYRMQAANDLGVGELSQARNFSTPESGMFRSSSLSSYA